MMYLALIRSVSDSQRLSFFAWVLARLRRALMMEYILGKCATRIFPEYTPSGECRRREQAIVMAIRQTLTTLYYCCIWGGSG